MERLKKQIEFANLNFLFEPKRVGRMNFMVKKTNHLELDLVFGMEISCFPKEFWSEEQIYSHHTYQDSIIYWIQAHPVGYLIYMQNQFEIEILRLGVLPDYRKQKIASQLIDFLKNTNKSKDVFLEVNEKNTSAISLYVKAGFSIVGKRKNYYQDKSNAILMKFSALERL